MAWRCALSVAIAAALAGCSGCSSKSDPVAGVRDAGPDAIADASAEDAASEVTPGDAADAAEDVYGSDWDAGNMLSDPSIWTPVPDNGGCGLYVAKVVPDPFQKRVWKSCGTGCEVSDVPLTGFGDNYAWYWGGVTASQRGTAIVMRATYHLQKGKSNTVASRIDDGTSIAAVEERNIKCSVVGTANDMALVFPMLGLGHRMRGGTMRGIPAWRINCLGGTGWPGTGSAGERSPGTTAGARA